MSLNCRQTGKVLAIPIWDYKLKKIPVCCRTGDNRRMGRTIWKLWPLAILLFTVGCAGPSTPFGPLNTVTLKKNIRKMASDGLALVQNETREKPSLNVYPSNFYVHRPFGFKVKVYDPNEPLQSEALRLEYNGIDVTDSVFKRAVFKTAQSGTAELTIDKIKLNPNHLNHIKIYYLSDTFGEVQTKLLPPNCPLRFSSHLKFTEKFQVDKLLVNEINSKSKAHGINSFLLAGLIAQESGFNSKSVSWAKAIGLTQVTPIAETEIVARHPEFPRYENLNDLSVFNIRSLIGMDIINSKNEWRLNHQQSIEGALTYMDILNEYWNREEQNKLINSIYFPNEIVEQRMKLILSSYNSGPFRVKNALKEKKQNWISSNELQEAKKYVGMIYSYCHSFENPEVTYK